MAPEGTAATPAAAAISAPGDDADPPASLLTVDGKEGLSNHFPTQRGELVQPQRKKGC